MTDLARGLLGGFVVADGSQTAGRVIRMIGQEIRLRRTSAEILSRLSAASPKALFAGRALFSGFGDEENTYNEQRLVRV